MTYDVVIIGGGPGGVAAGIYCARKKMKTLFLSESVGGQSAVSATIENWIGTVSLSGARLAQDLDTHIRTQEDIEIHVPERAVGISEDNSIYKVTTDKGISYETKTVIIASGGRHRHLDIPGEDRFAGKGVVYCSTCDAPFFRNRAVAVVGGGNSGLGACQDLFAYASKIYLLVRSGELKGDPILQEQVKNHPKVEIIYNAQSKEIRGEMTVSDLLYYDQTSGEDKALAVQGVFVEIGSIPNSEFVKDLVELDATGSVVIDHRTMMTSRVGIFAVGDVTDSPFKQNNISAGQGVIAALSAYEFIRKQ